MSTKSTEAHIEMLTGNVFKQLGLPNPEERLRKARLMGVINAALRCRGLSQKDAAQVTGLSQSGISRIRHGRGSRYSIEDLLNIIRRLGATS